MSKINFMLGIHNHQPVGNFDHVFEDSYQQSYLPFLQVLQEYPDVRMTLHYTGPLIEWFEANHPEIFEILISMVQSGQIEIMGGGFYEPILTVLSEKDAFGQIQMMSKYVKKKFKQNPSGFWLAERVWEPEIARFASTGLRYTLLDESHFLYAGLDRKDIHGYYVTEDQGQVLNIFPISYELRYLLPFQEVHHTEELLKKLAEDENVKGLSFADDGEKFGVWPGTHDWVYNQGWLHRFFTLLSENKDWINMSLFSEYLDDHKPEGRVYIPTASYSEMSEWSLLPDSGMAYEDMLHYLEKHKKDKKFEPYIRGGFWRNFLAKYDESNNMHKKMLEVSEKVHKMPDSKEKNKALKFLWKSQCNCPYWHGIFGGLYLNSLRFATYRNLLTAERLAESVLHKTKTWKQIKVYDFDKDGQDEVVVSTDKLNLYFSPANGGSLFEFDYKPRDFNFSDVLTRRKEAYHRKILEAQKGDTNHEHKSIHDIVNLKEPDIDQYLYYDNYRRASLVDHFLDVKTSLNDFMTEYKQIGDFFNNEYLYSYNDKKQEIVLQREGVVKNKGYFLPVHLKKRIKVEKACSEIEINYSITNKSEEEINSIFGMEFVFTLLAGDDPDRHYYIPGYEDIDRRMISQGELEDVAEVQAVDDWLRAKLVYKFKHECCLWRHPIFTVSNSEGGMERIYQGSVILPHWKIQLGAKERWNTRINLCVEDW